MFQLPLSLKEAGEASYQRGSILASHPSALGLILSISKNISTLLRFIDSAGKRKVDRGLKNVD